MLKFFKPIDSNEAHRQIEAVAQKTKEMVGVESTAKKEKRPVGRPKRTYTAHLLDASTTPSAAADAYHWSNHDTMLEY